MKFKSLFHFLVLISTCDPLFHAQKSYAIPVKNVYINFAGAGGNFAERYATFTVDSPTTVTAVTPELRLYEVHLAKMIEVTHLFCKEREGSYVIHWNYEADKGQVFMGEFPLSCQFAANAFSTFGTIGKEKITIHHRGNPVQEEIKVLNLQGANGKQFAALVRRLKPKCLESPQKVCPGDRLPS